MRSGLPLLVGLAMTAGIGCGDSESAPSGAAEPLRVQNGQFFAGKIPAGTAGPALAAVESKNNLIVAGEVGKKLSGRAKKGAYSVALRFEDLGTGYWVVPVGPPDPQTDGELTWEAVCDIARDASPGDHKMVFSAADSQARPGPVSELPVQIKGLVPDGKVVISLTWDSNADLDLHLVGPNGKELDPKHLTTAVGVDAGDGTLPPGTGVLDRDSNAACVNDGYRQEDVVWPDIPLHGIYLVRVDMFDACHEPAANYLLSVYANGALRLTRAGRLIDLDADGGGPGAGLFVVELTL